MSRLQWFLWMAYLTAAAGYGGWQGPNFWSPWNVLCVLLPPFAWGALRVLGEWRRNSRLPFIVIGGVMTAFAIVGIGGQALLLAWAFAEMRGRWSVEPAVHVIIAMAIVASACALTMLAAKLRKPGELRKASHSESTGTLAGPDAAADQATLADFVDALHRPGRRTAIISLGKEDGRTWTYGELHEQVQRLAAGLLRTNDDSRPTIALLADPGPEWVVACLAAVRAGLVATPIDVQSSDDVLRHIIEDSQSEIIFTTHRQRKRLDDLNLSRDRTVALLDAAEDDQACWRRWLSDEAGELPPVDADDTAILFYTSGTTGAPKGVPLCHRNIAYQIKTLSSADFIGEDDRVLLPLPLHHVYPLVVGMLAPLSIGLPVVLPFSLTGPQIRRALNECSATIVIGVPRLYEAFMSIFDSSISQPLVDSRVTA